MAILNLTAPNQAILVEKTGNIAEVYVRVPTAQEIADGAVTMTLEVADSVYVSNSVFTSLTDAFTAATAIDPNYPGEFAYGDLEIEPDYDVEQVNIRAAIGDPVTIPANYTSQTAGVTYTYKWYKEVSVGQTLFDNYASRDFGSILIRGATSSSLSGTVSDGMYGKYHAEVTAYDSSTNRTTTERTRTVELKPIPAILKSTDVLGGASFYGFISTGRGGGATASNGVNDLNATYIYLNDSTYTVDELELYIPTTNSVVPYDSGLSSPFQFDPPGIVFDDTGYEMQIRVAATGVVLHTVEVPKTRNNRFFVW